MRASTQTLVDAINAAVGTFGQPTPAQAALLERARADYYNDYFGEPDEPLIALVRDARAAGLPGIADQAINGDFDGTKAEADEWAASPEGQETFAELTRPR